MNNMKQYNSTEIEKKWQQYWAENNIYKVDNNIEGKENFYALSEFAYPSGNLHVGHWYAFVLPDIYARFKRMNGYNVLYPIGFDAFGLPAENAAIKRGLDPRKWTYENLDYMRGQLRSMGASFDWDRTFATCDPDYYKWTQWMFTEFYNNDLVHRKMTKTNWCESCKTVLANEQVVNGTCERCDNDVIQKDMAQWMLNITKFADELIDDLDNLDWDHSIKQAQREWIGRKEGSEISFPIKNKKQKIVILHGYTGSSKEVFIPWIKEELEKKNYKVESPDLPNTKNPTVQEQVDFVLKNVDFDEDTILLGHSLGTVIAMKVAEQKKLSKMILVAPFIDGDFKDHSRSFSKTFNYNFNFENIKDHLDEIIVLEDLGDYAVSKKQIDNVCKSLNSKRITVSAEKGHFCADIEPEILKIFNKNIDVFTTPADTLFGVTYVVLAPEHKLVQELKPQIQNWDEVEKYLKDTEKKSDLDRQQSKEKTGVFLEGVFVINPATNKEIPVLIADYVLAHFGTGAVMAVPAHDERDCEFAIKFDLPFKFVVLPSAGEIGNSRPLVTSGENAFILAAGTTEESGQAKINAEWNAMYDLLGTLDGGILPTGKRFCCTFTGKLINSTEEFGAITTKEAIPKITKHVNGILKKTYRLRDWGISRQRYWGTPIPMVYDPEGNAHIVPREHLPWILPNDVDYTPDGTAPLARSAELKQRTIDIFGVGWTPEVDTMDTFVDSSWYFYRYLDNKNSDNFASADAMKSWMPIDMYFGGAEHTTMHLLYSRFWVKALHSLNLVPANEPYKGRLNRGLILGPDGAKMSKSKGNVIDPDDAVSHVGADALRMYLAFMGPFNEPGNYPWDPNGVVGVRRFIERVWRLSEQVSDEKSPADLEKLVHKTIKKVTNDINRLKLNTAISSMMVLVNSAEKSKSISKIDYESLLKMFGTFAPHIAEEIWMEILGNTKSIHVSEWSTYDRALCVDDEVRLGIQINGKVRTEIMIPVDADSETVQEMVMKLNDVIKWIEGKEIKKFIYVKGRIVNIVV